MLSYSTISLRHGRISSINPSVRLLRSSFQNSFHNKFSNINNNNNNFIDINTLSSSYYNYSTNSLLPPSLQFSYRYMSNNNNNNNNTPAEPRRAYPPSDFPEKTFLKCIEKEIDDEKLRLDKEEGPPVLNGWEMFHATGTSIIYGRRYWMPPSSISNNNIINNNNNNNNNNKEKENNNIKIPPRIMERHTIRVQLTTRDPSLDPECNIRGEHFPFSLFIQPVVMNQTNNNNNNNNNMMNSISNNNNNITQTISDASSSSNSVGNSKFLQEKNNNNINDEEEDQERGLYEQSIEIRADFVDGELVIDNVVFHGSFKLPSHNNNNNNNNKTVNTEENKENKEKEDEDIKEVHYNHIFSGYPGPNLDEAEEEVLDGLQSYLAERCIDDQFGEFIRQYSVWIEQVEYERWLRQLRDFVAA